MSRSALLKTVLNLGRWRCEHTRTVSLFHTAAVDGGCICLAFLIDGGDITRSIGGEGERIIGDEGEGERIIGDEESLSMMMGEVAQAPDRGWAGL